MLGWLPLAYWVHTPHPFLVRFGESSGIRYYGLGYLAGFVAGAALLHWYYRRGRSPLDLNAISDLMSYLVAGVLLGGRVGYFIFYQPQALLSDPLSLFRVWQGGMASHGGFLGVILAMWFYARRKRIDFFRLSDMVVSVAPPGLFIVRIANFLNGELWGKVTDVPWAVIFAETSDLKPRHPSQLYEAALEGLFLFVLMQWRFWRGPARDQPGRVSGEFLLAYAVVRMVCEVFREPDATLILGLSRGTFYSLFLVAGGLAVIARSARRTS
jgi:phosphatidylglycerol:prolipoprotein diacylglycerol transferase